MACRMLFCNGHDWVAVQVPTAHMLCLGWSCDGSQLALGQADGGIAIRSAEGMPLGLVNSMAGIPVTSLAWFPSRCLTIRQGCCLREVSTFADAQVVHTTAPSDIAGMESQRRGLQHVAAMAH
jgi:WD40 repeat protein